MKLLVSACLFTLLLMAAGTRIVEGQERASGPEANVYSQKMTIPDIDKQSRVLKPFCLPGAGFTENPEIKKQCSEFLSMQIKAEQEHLLAQYQLERQFLKQRLDRYKASTAIEERIFENQITQGRYLFWLAIGLSILGVGAAVLQFLSVYKDLKIPTEVRVSTKELTVKTAWIGVVILSISMLFLAFVIYFVYQISPAPISLR